MTDSLAVPDESGEPRPWVWRGTPAPSQPACCCQAAGELPEGAGSRQPSLATGAPEEPHGARGVLGHRHVAGALLCLGNKTFH